MVSPLPQPPSLAELTEPQPVSLFLDFDGTLVDIAPGPDAIHVPHDLASRLERLSHGLGGRLALVSGRGLDNITQHLGAVGIARAGSHGAERVLADGRFLGAQPQALPAAALSELHEISDRTGALLERKAFGAALHYRANPQFGPTIERRARALAKAHGLAVKAGKCVIELVRPGADKGGAVEAFMGQFPFKHSTPIFVGDDVTDEDGFAAVQKMGGFGIAVGERASDKASCHLNSVAEVHEWLNL